MTRTPQKKKNQPPKPNDVFKLFRWYKKKWDRQAKERESEEKTGASDQVASKNPETTKTPGRLW